MRRLVRVAAGRFLLLEHGWCGRAGAPASRRIRSRTTSPAASGRRMPISLAARRAIAARTWVRLYRVRAVQAQPPVEEAKARIGRDARGQQIVPENRRRISRDEVVRHLVVDIELRFKVEAVERRPGAVELDLQQIVAGINAVDPGTVGGAWPATRPVSNASGAVSVARRRNRHRRDECSLADRPAVACACVPAFRHGCCPTRRAAASAVPKVDRIEHAAKQQVVLEAIAAAARADELLLDRSGRRAARAGRAANRGFQRESPADAADAAP